MSNRFLLDTHALLWFQENNPKIPNQVLQIIGDPDNTILFSQISLFEIAIKQRIGKLLSFKANTEEIYEQAINDGFIFINIQNPHIYRYGEVTLFEQHRDPFDRLLIATAIEENAVMLSNDDKLKLYSPTVDLIWS